MLRKTIATLGMSAAIVVPLAALSAGTAYADTTVPVSGCYGAAGNNLCLAGSVGVQSGTTVPVTTPVEVCVGSCIPAGSPIATVPVPVGGVVTPTVYGTGLLSGSGGVPDVLPDCSVTPIDRTLNRTINGAECVVYATTGIEVDVQQAIGVVQQVADPVVDCYNQIRYSGYCQL
ncbi:MAG: hypothetical protein ABR520_08625 [Mycobacteriales bacterium]|nr:hypothetical protein [Frankia sp.]